MGLIFDGNIESLVGDFVYDGVIKPIYCGAYGGDD